GPKDEVKQAERLADAGDKAAAAGKMPDALAYYARAVKAAPGNPAILRRAANVRAQVVQSIVDKAEMAALDGNVVTATNLVVEELRNDPGNPFVGERLAQLKQMPTEYLPVGDKEDYE